MKYLHRLLLFLVTCFCAYTLNAQKYDIENFSIEEGLPSLQVYNTVQDNNGYLWFSTDRGISRYDGYEFKNYDINDGLPNIVVLRLYKQANNEIWGATNSGELFYFSSDDYKIKKYKYNSTLKELIDGTGINSLYIDENRSIYLGFRFGSGFMRIDSNGVVLSTLKKKIETNLENKKKVLDDNGYVVNASSKAQLNSLSFTFNTYDIEGAKELLPNFDLRIYKSQTSILIRYNNKYVISERKDERTLFVEDYYIGYQSIDTNWFKKLKHAPIGIGTFENDKIWVGAIRGGIEVYSYKGELISSFLPNKAVSDLFMDHNDGVWIATLGSGVFYIKNTDVVNRKVSAYDNTYKVRDMFSTEKDEVYISYYSAEVLKFSKEGIFTIMPKVESSLYNYAKKKDINSLRKNGGYIKYDVSVQNIIGYNKNIKELLLLKNRGLSIFLGEKNINHGRGVFKQYNTVDRVLVNDEDYVLVGNYGFGTINKEGDYHWNSLSKHVNSVKRFDNGWYVATNDGLYFYAHDETFEPMIDKDSLFQSSIKDISGNNDYTLLTTLGEGLVVFNNDTVFQLTQDQGFYNNNLERISKQDDSTYLVSSNYGLNRIQFSGGLGSYLITGINKTDGLLSNSIENTVIVGDSIWVTTDKGINVFPSSILDEKPVARLYLRIKDIGVNNTSVSQDNLNKLSYTDNSLKVEFGAVSFNRNEELEYRYRIEGLESQWNYTSSRVANYPSLPPGGYTFVVEANDGRSGFGEGASFEFTILPPYYATWWFKAILVFTISTLVYLFFRVRILTYNQDIIRELLRHFLKWIRRNQKYIIIKSQGKNIKLITSDIYYIKSSGNYIEVYTAGGMHLVRAKIGEFIEELPDQIEFLRVHRSYIVRLDKVEQHDSNTIVVKGEEIPIGSRYKATYLKSVF